MIQQTTFTGMCYLYLSLFTTICVSLIACLMLTVCFIFNKKFYHAELLPQPKTILIQILYPTLRIMFTLLHLTYYRNSQTVLFVFVPISYSFVLMNDLEMKLVPK